MRFTYSDLDHFSQAARQLEDEVQVLSEHRRDRQEG